MRIKCCQYCEDRYPGCHSKCEEYIEEKQRLDKFNERKRNEDQAKKFRNDRISDVMAGFAVKKSHRNSDRFFKKDK